MAAFPTVETAVAEASRRLSLAKRLDHLVHTKERDHAQAEWQGLTLVHFSAQPEPFLTQNTP